MFLHLWILTGVFVSIQNQIYSNITFHTQHFPGIVKSTENKTFSLNLSANAANGFIIVKCPYESYKPPGNVSDSFQIPSELNTSQLITVNKDKQFNWMPLLKSLSESTIIECGQYLEKINGNPIPYNWTYNLNWNAYSNQSIPVVSEDMSSHRRPIPKNCDNNSTKILIFTKDKHGNITKVEIYGEISLFQNQIFYYFSMNENTTRVIKEPCAILKVKKPCPKIEITKQDITLVDHGSIKINVAKMKENKEKYNVKLSVGNDSNYYSEKTISVSKLRYHKNGVDIIKNFTKPVAETLDIDVFDLYKITYNCQSEGNLTIISQIYYFEPTNSDYKYQNDSIIYNKDDLSVKPNCSRNRLTYGYLEAIVQNGVRINLTDLTLSSENVMSYNINDKFIYLTNIKNDTTILECIYRTPSGEVTISSSFSLRNKMNEQNSNGTKSDNITRISRNGSKSWYQSLVHKHGKSVAITIIFAIILAIILVIIGLSILLYFFIIKDYIELSEVKEKYRNVYDFWYHLRKHSLEKYCENVNNIEYISEKLKSNKIAKKIEGGEECDIDINHIYDDTLIKSYDSIDKAFKAHYVFKDSFERTYIISDSPTKETRDHFWKMIFEENVQSVIAIIYKRIMDTNNHFSNKIYWPDNDCKYGNITVELIEREQLDLVSITCHFFKMTNNNNITKTVRIYHFNDWPNHGIPPSELYIVNLYKTINALNSSGNVLVHAFQGTGSRVYMYTFFVCIYDTMLNNINISNPMEVIKEIRDKRFGGNLASYEYAYVINALVTIFFENKMLIDNSYRSRYFLRQFDNYLSTFLKRENRMSRGYAQFLMFVNIIDLGKLREIKTTFAGTGILSDSILKEKCKRFYALIEDKSIKKIRHRDIPCFDSTLVDINEKNEKGFVHANTFIYKNIEGLERKLILCQAPVKESFDDMFDMIYKHNVAVIIILLRPDEAPPDGDKWVPYLPTSNEILKTQKYVVKCKKYSEDCMNMIFESEYTIEKSKEKPITFRIFHYHGWPDKGVPSNHKDVYELIKKIQSCDPKNYVAINCSSGIGRSGTIAFILHLIDTFSSYINFEPIERLRTLRENRYKSVQTFSQFVFAILIVYEHFKDHIDNMDPRLYPNFVKLTQKVFKDDNF
uniref:Tyrosine-protein phosphatase domain-containing protein n=1 Tax=Strongyloides papillosus TaxID=174720 RepID=A0A0N5C0X1_STREA